MAQYTFDTLFDFEFSKIVLPSGYTKLNYIENTDKSYILLNYKANNNTIVETTLSYNSTSGDPVPYGCDHWYEYRNSGFIVFLSPSLNVDFGNQRFNLNKSIDIDTWYTFQQSQDGFFLNSNKLTNFNSQTFTCTNNFAIFTFGVGLSGNSFLNGKMKAISVKDLTENFELIACKNPNNEIGMCDVLNNVFHGNNGTGTFTSGGTAPTYTFQNGDTCTITELGITLTSNGTDWYVTSDITIPTLSQATQLFAFAKSNNGVTVTVTSTGVVYKYEGDDWQIWYTIIPPLVFRGITFEQTDFWQIPEMVFRGMTFEITDKVGGASMFHGMS